MPSLSSRYCGDVYIIQCDGRIAMGEGVKALERALDSGACEFERIVLNMGRVEYLDSTGIGLLVRYAQNMRKRGGDLRLAEPMPFPIAVLKLANLSSFLPVHATEDAAILSFVKSQPALAADKKSGARVLVVDESPDFCTFMRTVLTQHGFDVKSTTHFRDARILVQVESLDYILVGPDTPLRSADAAAKSLGQLSPKTVTLQLVSDFKALEGHDATRLLLSMFGR
jgi:anti-anti-sigma factor